MLDGIGKVVLKVGYLFGKILRLWEIKLFK